MSEDLKNSIFLWLNGICFAALIWAGLHFSPMDGVAKKWLNIAAAALGIFNLAWFFWGLWQRRASTPNNPNQR